MLSTDNTSSVYRKVLGDGYNYWIAIASTVSVLLFSGIFVMVDFQIMTESWPIMPGAVVIVLGLFMAFFMLALPAYSLGQTSLSAKVVDIFPSIVVIIPPLITGIGIAIQQAPSEFPNISRVAIVFAAGMNGLVARNNLVAESPSQIGRREQTLDTIRRTVLMFVLAASSTIYVSMPSLIIETSP